MGCGCGKGQARQLHNVYENPTGPLPSSLAAASRGRFQSTLPPPTEGRRDFARIFFADEGKIFVVAGRIPKMRALQPTVGPRSAHIGDLSEQVVELAGTLFSDCLTRQLAQVSNIAPDSPVAKTLCARAMAATTVNLGVDFALHKNLLPTFLQPFFLIVILGDLKEARVATYGFIAERPQQIVGDRPDSKRTNFCVRLLSPNLLIAADDMATNWEVEYLTWHVSVPRIRQAVEMEMPKVHEAISTGRWDPML